MIQPEGDLFPAETGEIHGALIHLYAGDHPLRSKDVEKRNTSLRGLPHRLVEKDCPTEVLADPGRSDDELPISPSVLESRRDAGRFKTPGDGGQVFIHGY